ncbi:hypothetical protein PF004_g22719 [Phytophthora fragariae]|uniref:Uncharacterized protein n=1 Tax=Phytophthora fragariae TaxID=53985 RepID=A0A6G0MZ90_9STRA|nr:hypothetical protein PF004_g22719 [Phytophthora fragariae]
MTSIYSMRIVNSTRCKRFNIFLAYNLSMNTKLFCDSVVSGRGECFTRLLSVWGISARKSHLNGALGLFIDGALRRSTFLEAYERRVTILYARPNPLFGLFVV